MVAGTAAVLLIAGPASATVSPGRLLSSALTAARGQRSVHYAVTQTYPGVTTGIVMVGDAAVDRGIQHITYRKAGRVGHVTVRVVANTAYIRGDAFTLTNYMGFSAGTAAGYAGRWLLLPHTASGFTTVAAGVRLGSTIDELKMPHALRLTGTTTLGGSRVVGVQTQFSQAGRQVTEQLYVRATGAPLPVEQRTYAGTARVVVAFSGWNEPVHLSAPAHAVPIS